MNSVNKIILLFLFLSGMCTQAFAFTISGTVYGNSSPLSNVSIDLFDAAGGAPLDTTTSDGNGFYTFTEVIEGTYDLFVTPYIDSGFANSPVEGIVVSGADVTQNIVLVSGSVTLSGVVYAQDGSTPASNIYLQIKTQSTSTYVAGPITEADGSYTVSLTPGTYKVYAQSSAQPSSVPTPQTFYMAPFLDNLVVAADTVLDLTLPMATISGLTVNSAGDPVPDVEIKMNYFDPANGYTTINNIISDSITGEYSFTVMAGPGTLSIIAPEGSGYASEVISDFEMNSDMSHNFVLKAPLIFSGTVSIQDGITPASNVALRINEQTSGDLVAERTTDASGKYSASLAPGTYEIWVSGQHSSLLPQYFTMMPYIEDLVLTTDTVRNITLPLATVSGFTVNSTGDPVGNVTIKMDYTFQIDGNYNAVKNTVVSDPISGAYSFIVRTGPGAIALLPPDGSGYAAEVLNDFQMNGDMSHNFVLQTPVTVSGTVYAQDGTTPAGNIRVRISDQASNTLLAQPTTDSAGYYSAPLAPGTFRIDIVDTELIPTIPTPQDFSLWPLITDFIVTTDTVRDITLPFATVSGFTTDRNGVPVGNVGINMNYILFGGGTYNTVKNNVVSHPTTGAYSYTVTAGTGSIVIVPPLGSGFAENAVNNMAMSADMLMNVILTFIDDQDPVILSGPTVTDISDSSATVEWQTNELASGTLYYGLDSAPTSGLTETSQVTVHSQTLTGLNADTLYYVKVSATDLSANGPVESGVISFRTTTTPDITAPVIISGPIVTAISHNSAVIEWSTNEPSTGAVTSGTSVSLGQSESDGLLSTFHQVTLSGLNAETIYYFRVEATDASGNGPTLSDLMEFNTVTAPDTAPPLLVEGPMAIDITGSGATIIWTTDEPATSGVSYNDGTVYGVFSDNALVTEHSVHLENLSPATLYNFTISCRDGLNNGPTLSTEKQFTTLATADTHPPVIIEYPVKHVNHQQAIIAWRTDESASSVIEYGLDPTQLTAIESHVALTRPHNMTLTGLASGTTHYFRILSTDAVGNTSTSRVWSFTTDPAPNSKKPVVTRTPQAVYSGDDTLTILWETDEPTDTVLEYTPAGQAPIRRSKETKENKHQITLKGLTPGTAYDIAVAATDVDGNTTLANLSDSRIRLAFIGDAGLFIPQTTANTLVDPDITAPLITVDPTIIGSSNTSATIQWTTDEFSDSLVRYGLTSEALTLQAGNIIDADQHTVVLTNLSANTPYYYTVESTDPSGNGPTVSNVFSFTTLAAADNTAPTFTIAPGPYSTSQTQAVMEWETNEAASTVLHYGLSSGNLNQSSSLSELALEHRLTLTNLLPGTIYYFSAEATDSSGNTANSVEDQFTTVGTGTPGTDSDHDGIDDNWEISYFGNLSTAHATSDFDRDMYTDKQEYLNQMAGERDADAYPFNPLEANAPHGPGYKQRSNILNMIVPVLIHRYGTN